MSLLSGMITTKEVSEMTGISSATLAAWRRTRQHIPFYKIGKIVKYKPEDVEAFIERCVAPIVPVDQVEEKAPTPKAKK